MRGNHSRARGRILCEALTLAVALLGWAWPASAARVIDVRVGQHGEFTRIVFDLDGPARYHLEHSEAGAAVPEIVVHFEAGAQPKAVRTLSKLVESVRLETRPEGAVARIALRSRDVHVVEEALSAPPRIVIDLRASGGAGVATAKPSGGAPPRAAAPPAEPAAAPRAAQAAAPPPSAANPPTPPRTTAELIEAQADAAAARLLGSESRGAQPAGAPQPAVAPAEPGAGAPAPTAQAQAENAPAPSEPAPSPAAAPSSPPPELPREAGKPPGTLGSPPPPPLFGPPPWSEPWRFVTGAVLLVLALLVWFIFRRREPSEDLPSGAIPADAFLDRMTAFGDSTERAEEGHAEEAPLGSEGLPLFAAASASERTIQVPLSEAGATRPAERSLFGEPPALADTADKSVSHADLEQPTPALGERGASPGSVPAASHTDESPGRLRDLEQRLAQIEQRLTRDGQAREQLERQVVAQTEELRVQRAAIARTQRVLRTLSRPEDLATEPVIKSPGPSGSAD
jgi:hypothetical protein